MNAIKGKSFRDFSTGPVPVAPYVSAAYFELEKEHIFRNIWQFVAREQEFKKPGDFIVQEFEIFNASVLIIKGKDGKIRAFHNVCSHRGVKLVLESHGNTASFMCHYHGWGYALDGKLRAVPDAESFEGLDRSSCGLTPIHLGIFEGFIFINFAAQPPQTLIAFLGPIANRMTGHPYEDFDSSIVIETEVDVNWKLLLDNFQETYHLSFVHHLSLADKSTGRLNPFGKPISCELFDPHRYMEIWGNREHLPAPGEAIAAKYGGVLSQGATQQKDEHKSARSPDWAQDTYAIFPNLIIDVSPGLFFTQQFIPRSVGRTLMINRLYLPEAKTPGQRFSQEYTISFLRDTVSEDARLLRTQQQSLLSGAKTEIFFSAQEAMCRHSLQQIENYIHKSALEPTH